MLLALRLELSLKLLGPGMGAGVEGGQPGCYGLARRTPGSGSEQGQTDPVDKLQAASFCPQLQP